MLLSRGERLPFLYYFDCFLWPIEVMLKEIIIEVARFNEESNRCFLFDHGRLKFRWQIKMWYFGEGLVRLKKRSDVIFFFQHVPWHNDLVYSTKLFKILSKNFNLSKTGKMTFYYCALWIFQPLEIVNRSGWRQDV